MSRKTLEGLRNYLYSTLSVSDMLWLGIQLSDYARHQKDNIENNLKLYTRQELIARAEDGRKEIASGNYSDINVLLRELDEDFKEDMREDCVVSSVEKFVLQEV